MVLSAPVCASKHFDAVRFLLAGAWSAVLMARVISA